MIGSDQQYQSESENTSTVTCKIKNRTKLNGNVKTTITFMTQGREMRKPNQLTGKRKKRRKRNNKTENRSNGKK